jgi:predicted transcriptional regulator
MLPSYVRKARRNGFLVNKNRDSLSIIASILEITNSGAKKTKIMFSANLSYSLLMKYLNLIVEAGFIQLEDSIYHLTSQGREFLSKYENFEERYLKAQNKLEALTCEHKQLQQICTGIKII